MQITDVGFANQLRREPNLEFLEVGHCNQLTDGCLSELESQCPRLRRLLFSDRQFNQEAENQFRSRRRRVDVDKNPVYTDTPIRSGPVLENAC